MLSDAVLATRNSGQTLYRFCIGFLGLSSLRELGALPKSLSENGDFLREHSIEIASQVVLIFVLSLLLGAILVHLGQYGMGKNFSEKEFAKRAKTVGDTKNPLLAEFLREANNKFYLASGIMGLLAFMGTAMLFEFLFGARESAPSTLVSLDRIPRLIDIVALIIGFFISRTLRASATAGIEALDEILEKGQSKKEV